MPPCVSDGLRALRWSDVTCVYLSECWDKPSFPLNLSRIRLAKEKVCIYSAAL